MLIFKRALLLILLFASCNKDASRYGERVSYYRNLAPDEVCPDSLVVMTYNIQNGFTGGYDPWERNNTGATPEYLNLMSAFLSMSGADIIALQEVPLDRSNAVIKRLLDSLGHRLHMNYAFAAHGFNDAHGAASPIRGQWGNAILSRYPIMELEGREIAYTGVWTRRTTLRTRIRLREDKLIDVYSLHHSTATAYSDLRASAEFVHESPLPKVVCGDFNSAPDSPAALLRLLPAWDIREMGIDQIFHSPEFSAGQVERYPGVQLSDHAPVSVLLKF